ncbi:hypothetical protein [Paenibacillus tyrfis]|uniref:hypothetical protein n=1 Tax=Paenibacillus tyrfis TaxID=1501230 RepID=UPI000B58AFBC|nr:hypothetical protein [Paenibacillus tyrfis]
MALSNRAFKFLASSKWKDSVKDEKEIIHAFQAAKIMPTEQLIDFQKRFGGFTYFAYLEPIVYGILHKMPCRGSFVNENGLIAIEPEDDIVVRHFECADTLYQETFSIDEQGRYYEGFDLKCNHFETHIEDLAMLEQVNKGKWGTVYKYELDVYRDCYEYIDEKKYGKLVKRLGLKKVEDFPEDIVSWDTNGDMLVWRKADAVVVLSETGINQRELEAIQAIFEQE